MSIFLKDQWQEWARDWGLAHYPEKGWLHRTERVIGARKGLLIRVGWGSDQNPGLIVCVRFPRAGDPQRLRQALIDDSTLDTLPGKISSRRKMVLEIGPRKMLRLGEPPVFILTDTALVWRRVFAFRAPKAEQIEAWVDALIDAVARATPVFDGRCETCGSGVAERYVVVNDLPTMMCLSCQQRLKIEGDMAERTYEMTEARHLPGAALALVAAVLCAVAWAAIGALTERIFSAAAIGIGALVAWAYRQGSGRVDAMGRVIAVGLTLASMALGDVLLLTWWVAKARPDIGLNLEAGWYVYVKSWAENPGSEIVTLLFALVGAWVAAKALQRPKLKASIEAAGEPEGERRKAA